MIEFISGDMFAKHYDIRVNPVNVVGTMGAGLALKFKRLYPEMAAEHQKLCKAGGIKIGELHIWKPMPLLEDEWIVNFPTKRHWKEDSRYEDIEAGLVALRKYLTEQFAGTSIAIPALGCGHGGLSWGKVSKLISDYLQGLQINITVFNPKEGK